MADSVRIHAIVSGAVQGVGFRFSAQSRARELGLTGYVRNLTDGTVETEAQGEPSAVDRFLSFLRTGPDFADVMGVAVERVEVIDGTGFELRH